MPWHWDVPRKVGRRGAGRPRRLETDPRAELPLEPTPLALHLPETAAQHPPDWMTFATRDIEGGSSMFLGSRFLMTEALVATPSMTAQPDAFAYAGAGGLRSGSCSPSEGWPCGRVGLDVPLNHIVDYTNNDKLGYVETMWKSLEGGAIPWALPCPLLWAI